MYAFQRTLTALFTCHFKQWTFWKTDCFQFYDHRTWIKNIKYIFLKVAEMIYNTADILWRGIKLVLVSMEKEGNKKIDMETRRAVLLQPALSQWSSWVKCTSWHCSRVYIGPMRFRLPAAISVSKRKGKRRHAALWRDSPAITIHTSQHSERKEHAAPANIKAGVCLTCGELSEIRPTPLSDPQSDPLSNDLTDLGTAIPSTPWWRAGTAVYLIRHSGSGAESKFPGATWNPSTPTWDLQGKAAEAVMGRGVGRVFSLQMLKTFFYFHILEKYLVS